MFDHQIPFGGDVEMCFRNTRERSETIESEELLSLQKYVRDQHTFVNRAKSLISFF